MQRAGRGWQRLHVYAYARLLVLFGLALSHGWNQQEASQKLEEIIQHAFMSGPL